MADRAVRAARRCIILSEVKICGIEVLAGAFFQKTKRPESMSRPQRNTK